MSLVSVSSLDVSKRERYRDREERDWEGETATRAPGSGQNMSLFGWSRSVLQEYMAQDF